MTATTHLWLLALIDPAAQHKDGNVVLRRAEHVVGQGEQLLGPHHKPRLLERLPLGARKIALADLEVAAGELPLA
jgi:hypothetical protein